MAHHAMTVADVVAIDIVGGPEFVDALRRIWDAGDAALPLDPRQPSSWRQLIIETLAPTAIVEADGIRRSLAGRPTEAGDALVMPTSGTTGTPKGVVLTTAALEVAALVTTSYLATDVATTWLACLPLTHIGGFSVITRALFCSTGLVVQPGFDVDAVESAVRTQSVTHVSLVPTALQRLDPTLFRRILLGGSAIPEDRPPNAVATYGMTESGAGVVYDGLPLNGIGVQIEDDGVVSLRGPTMMRCYRDGTAPFDWAGWYRTGDCGSIDPETGRLTIEGRSDELIITGGENVWPAPVEAALLADPRISDVAVVGRPDPEWGQRVTALIVPAEAHNLPTIEELRELVRTTLPAWAAPKSVEFVTDLPRTAIGKLRRSELAQR